MGQPTYQDLRAKQAKLGRRIDLHVLLTSGQPTKYESHPITKAPTPSVPAKTDKPADSAPSAPRTATR